MEVATELPAESNLNLLGPEDSGDRAQLPTCPHSFTHFPTSFSPPVSLQTVITSYV